MTEVFLQVFIYLCAAVVTVPLAKRLGLGSVLGYLIAGVIIGPVTGLVGQETNTIQHFAEFGVVMMLFLVGLELEPAALWQMRHRLVGLGGCQLLLTTLIIGAIAYYMGLPWNQALAIGLIFSLSSTAIVLQTFHEKSLGQTEGGRSAFSVLLFQDIAVIPMLAVLPLLALDGNNMAVASTVSDAIGDDISLVAQLPHWAAAVVILAAIVGLVMAGHYLSRPLLRYVAEARLREAFTATALMLVVGIAVLMSLVGLSPALGTFLAGVVMANSEFRHELEADIEPFKGLLLGLFFITVGAEINFHILMNQWPQIIALTLCLMLIKGVVLFGLAAVFGVCRSHGWLLTLSLAQAGEFGFVMLNYASNYKLFAHDLSQLLSMVVALSMFLTPALFIVFDRAVKPRYFRKDSRADDEEIDARGPVIIAGVGRFGQVINRLLMANQVPTVVLDYAASQVDRLRKVGVRSYFGDASRPELLHRAGIEEASLLVIAIDDRHEALQLVSHCKRHYPQLILLVRAFDRAHGYELKEAGADAIVSETYLSALSLGGEALKYMGFHPFRVEQLKKQLSGIEEEHFDTLFEKLHKSLDVSDIADEDRQRFLQFEEKLLSAMQRDRLDHHSNSERGWTPPPKGYLHELQIN